MGIPNPLRWLFSAGAVALGAGFYIVLLVIVGLSLPFNVIALMHFFGWEWWSALMAAALLSVIPLLGQLAYVVLAIAGAIFLYQANFDWRAVAYPEPKTISLAAMTSDQFAEFKKNITPQLERNCKQEALAQNSVDGKLPIAISKRCECFAHLMTNTFSLADWEYLEAHSQPSQAATDRLRLAMTQSCN